MKTLIVMRHAKSSWGDPGAADIDRPLNKRGRASAAAIGEWLRFGGFGPDLVLCSSERRTAETWEHMGFKAEARFLPSLYHAGLGEILRAVRWGEGNCVLLLGHNPGLAAFAASIVDKAPSHERFYDYPTAATMVAQFEGDWADLELGRAKSRAFTVPRDLIE